MNCETATIHERIATVAQYLWRKKHVIDCPGFCRYCKKALKHDFIVFTDSDTVHLTEPNTKASERAKELHANDEFTMPMVWPLVACDKMHSDEVYIPARRQIEQQSKSTIEQDQPKKRGFDKAEKTEVF